ncbi:hypothetical protein [Tropicibacter sp. S64]|uniref:hypothetical protein n=1 Tax=Tropicibacter sp. S64 TaxID=3415122 RepID=UPI003C7E56E3
MSDAIWVIESIETSKYPMAEYDHDRSSMESYNTLIGEPFPEEGEAMLTVDCSLEAIAGRSILSCTSHCLFLRGPASDLFRELGPAVSIKRATLRAENGVCSDAVLVKPLVIAECLDRDASRIDWLWKGRYVSRVHRLVLKAGCMEGHDFVRDEATGLLLISDRIKAALEGIDADAFAAVRPKDYRTGRR